MTVTQRSTDRDTALRARAERVVPGGMYGHLSAARLPPPVPQFFLRGEGCRVWDADRNEYVDLMCSWGPILLGHRDPRVEAAVRAQLADGECLNGPTPRFVELAELLTDTVAHADWAMFSKNGTDATTLAVTIARAATGRRKLLVADGAYHGAAPWCTPVAAGVTPEDRANNVRYEYNDIASVEAALAETDGEAAAIIACPMRHDIRRELELADPSFARALRALATRHGAALILDDVRCGLRIDPQGSWEPLGVRPDLSAWSKAIANGYPLACVLGIDALRDAARQVYSTGSFWAAASPMAASLATLDVVRDGDVVPAIERAGERLRRGLGEQARAHAVRIAQSGPVQMPFMMFADDAGFERAQLWTAECARGGVYVNPFHNWFLSAAHTDADIERALQGTDAAFAAVAERFGANSRNGEGFDSSSA